MGGGDDDVDTCVNWDEKTLRDVVEANQKKYKSYLHNFITR